MSGIVFNNWDRWYELIVDDFGFSKCDDLVSARLLDEKISAEQIINIDDICVHTKCIVFGAGPSIKKHISFIKQHFDLNEYTLIAADGANTALIEENIFPDIIVTDLDGNMCDIIKSNHRKSVLFVHAHGDNMDKIKEFLPMLHSIVPTCQCKSFGRLHNYGGFTDGDRAVHIAVYALKMKKVILAGMDYGNIVTRYSRPDIAGDNKVADEFKKKKLEYAEKLVNSLKKNNVQTEIITLNDSV